MLAFGLVSIFRLEFKLLLLSRSLRSGDGRTLYELYSPYFSSEVMVTLTRSVRGHFVTLTKVDMHLIKRNPGRIFG